MQTTFKLFFSCLICFTLSLASGYGQAPIAEQNRKAGERMVLKIQDIEYAFRWCPPGTFMMGPTSEERRRHFNETGKYLVETQYRVTLSRGFWILETEVTQEMWEKVMGDNPSKFKGAKLPVETVSWNRSQNYIKKLNDLGVAPAGFKFSLPTEAQWEYACRAGTTTTYHFGNDAIKLGDYAWYRKNCDNKTEEVGQKKANAWGLYDIYGNVDEWCADWFTNFYPSDAVTDPTGPPDGANRVVRGGSWRRGFDDSSRSWARHVNGPSSSIDSLGLRLALVSQ